MASSSTSIIRRTTAIALSVALAVALSPTPVDSSVAHTLCPPIGVETASTATVAPAIRRLRRSFLSPFSTAPQLFSVSGWATIPRGGDNSDDGDHVDIGYQYDETQEYDDEEYGDEIDDEEYGDEIDDGAKRSRLERGGVEVPELGGTPQYLNISVVSFASSLVKAAGRAYKAGYRAILGDGDEEDHSEEGGAGKPAVLYTFLGRTYKVLGKMYQAAIYPDEDRRERELRSSRKRKQPREQSSERGNLVLKSAVVANGGGIDDYVRENHMEHVMRLARRYGATLSTDEDDVSEEYLSKKYEAILGGRSFTDALKAANSDARLLVCYILPKSKKKGEGDLKSKNGAAILSILSTGALRVMNRKARKKQEERTGSFYAWICDGNGNDASPSEISAAARRLKVKYVKGQEGPILAVVYPALAADPSTGRQRITPVLLAQHHCNPPPNAEATAAWLSALRKRHAKQYAKMQRDRVEARLFRERVEGYASSVDGDAQREIVERRREDERRREEQREQERVEALERRREGLLATLLPEPKRPAVGESDEGVTTVALRFADGMRDQRRFAVSTTTMNDVFNWVDAVHKMEREKVVLTTMNGKQTFKFVDADYEGDDNETGEESTGDNEGPLTLEETGLGRMTAFRVSTLVENTGDERDDEDGGEQDVA